MLGWVSAFIPGPGGVRREHIRNAPWYGIFGTYLVIVSVQPPGQTLKHVLWYTSSGQGDFTPPIATPNRSQWCTVDLANYVWCVEIYVTVSGSKLRKYDYISCIKVEMEKWMSNYEQRYLIPNDYTSLVTIRVSLNQTDTDRRTCICAPQMDPKE